MLYFSRYVMCFFFVVILHLFLNYIFSSFFLSAWFIVIFYICLCPVLLCFALQGLHTSAHLTLLRKSSYNMGGWMDFMHFIHLRALHILLFLQNPAWQNNDDTRTHSKTEYLSELSEALCPHFLPMWIPGIRLNRRSITVSEHLESQRR